MTDRVQFLPPNSQQVWRPVAKWSRDEWRCWLEQHQWTEDQIRQYLDWDRYHYGFGVLPSGLRAQDGDIGDEHVNWLYQPSPKGVTLHASTTANTLWGGSAGGTKSYSARWEALRCCDAREDFRAIMVRREREELRRTHLDKLEREIVRLNRAYGEECVRLVGQPPVLSFKRSGAKVVFGHCNNDGDEEKYLSEDYDLFIGDEATRLLRKQIVGIAGRVRNDPKLGLIGRMILTTNPGGPGHDYCVTHFLEKTVPLEENPDYDPVDYTFIRASLYDNPHYMDPDGTYRTYEKRLNAYAPDRRKQLLDGDWSAIVDQFFHEFSPARHVADVEIPAHAHVLGSMQWGYSMPGMFLWTVVLPDGRLHVAMEHPFKATVPAVVAAHVTRLTQAREWTLQVAYGNVEMGDRGKGGEDVFEALQMHGLFVLPSRHERINGLVRVRDWFHATINGQPAITISPRCAKLIRTLPQLVQDDTHPEDMADTPESDYGAHALRFAIMARPRPSPEGSKLPPGPGTAGELMQQAMADARRLAR